MFFYTIKNLPKYVEEFKSQLAEDTDGIIVEGGLVVLENGYVRIELSLEIYGDKQEREFEQNYSIYTKGNTDTWTFAGYLNDFGKKKYAVDVDFSASDWEEQLKADMQTKLDMAIAQFGLKIDEPNWDDEYESIMMLHEINKNKEENNMLTEYLSEKEIAEATETLSHLTKALQSCGRFAVGKGWNGILDLRLKERKNSPLFFNGVYVQIIFEDDPDRDDGYYEINVTGNSPYGIFLAVTNYIHRNF